MRMVCFLWFFFVAVFSYGQKGFQWESKKDKIVIPFTFVDNLIIIPMEINNTKLNMLLDSGSEPSVLFSFPENDSIQLFNTRKIKISGLGNEEIAEGLFSENNVAKIGEDYVHKGFDVLIILDENLNFSSRIGIPVNGILGYSFFTNHVVKIDYVRKKITLYKDKKVLESNKMKSFTRFPISIVKDRPYLDVKTKLDQKEHHLKLLIDTGLGDGLWLFENDSIKANNKYFNDVLGEGIGGTVFGKKSRLDEIQFSKFKLISPLVSYPDTASYKQLRLINKRNGSIGGGILKRFTIFFDFQDSQVFLKENNLFGEPFNYNMSGLEIHHAGVQWVKDDLERDPSTKNLINVNDIVFDNSNLRYKFTLKPIFEIATIRQDSPAEKAGLLVGDIVLKIDGRNISNFSKQRIDQLLQAEDGKSISIEIERKGVKKKVEFQLKKIL